MEDQKVIVLRKPVMIGETTFAELVLREPVALEMSKAVAYGGENNIAVAISLISQVAGVPLAVVNQLGRRDFMEANNFLAGSATDGQETGETSSES